MLRAYAADLWPVERRFREPDLAVTTAPLAYGPAARARLDQSRCYRSLKLAIWLRRDMRDTCLGLLLAKLTAKRVDFGS